jgi:phosphoglycolate phosphatase
VGLGHLPIGGLIAAASSDIARLAVMLSPPRSATKSSTIVLDLDGTIADTAADLIDAAHAALASEGFAKAPAEAVKKGVGYGTKAMLQSALLAMGTEADAGQMERMSAVLAGHYEQNIALQTRLFPGFIAAAELLRQRGAKLALCTNKWERLALRLLSELGIGEFFDAIACRDTFAFHKPDPRHVTELIRLAGGERSAALMVGDSESDVSAARDAGIPVIVTAFGYASVPAHELGADAVLSDFSELPALAAALLSSY